MPAASKRLAGTLWVPILAHAMVVSMEMVVYALTTMNAAMEVIFVTLMLTVSTTQVPTAAPAEMGTMEMDDTVTLFLPDAQLLLPDAQPLLPDAQLFLPDAQPLLPDAQLFCQTPSLFCQTPSDRQRSCSICRAAYRFYIIALYVKMFPKRLLTLLILCK
ncbi:hypothetical protein OS493_026785 [Desmophyllum pertusum]|uniref:Uncharacterized protein n=1 Tax=Desmophyllum pertusum TaxID=174260 RepID=A0A9W9ZLG9_9CNID|nr:hypothetical protein OS493_026785 [Desmophyllum pertusum]